MILFVTLGLVIHVPDTEYWYIIQWDNQFDLNIFYYLCMAHNENYRHAHLHAFKDPEELTFE